MLQLIKSGLFLFLLVASCLQAGAAEFSARRGLNLDLWTTWPPERSWAERHVLLPFPEWRRTVGRAEFEALRQAGFDFLRMPVDPAPFLSAVSAGHRESLVKAVVESARIINAAGLKVIVDLHLIPGGGERGPGMEEVMGDPELFERYRDLVGTIGGALAGEDPRQVAFELMNEPVIDCDAGEDARTWPGRLARLHAAARAAAPRLTLVLPGACYSSAYALARMEPAAIDDRNVMWTFHFYEPFLLTHQGATWAGDFVRYVTGLPYPLHAVPPARLEEALQAIRARIRSEAPFHRRAGMLAYLDEEVALIDSEPELQKVLGEAFGTVAEWAARNGIQPDDILLGEFGMIRQEWGNPYVVPAAERAAYVRDVIGLAERYGFAWAIWGYGGAFGVVEAFEGRPAESDILDVVRGLD